jgi:arylsulfatase A-like enzyme
MRQIVSLLSRAQTRTTHTIAAIMAFSCVGSIVAVLALAQATRTPTVLPQPEPPFRGKIGRTVKESTPDFPKEVQAPDGAPNVLLIMTDDVGFGASSTFGGPIPTPTMDALAKNGLRFNEFHTTALCSPTRAALITGRNHHTASTGNIMEFATGYPGYNSLMSRSVGTVAEMLKYNGYTTAWFGKDHNVPDWHSSMAGPFDLWPTGLGFDYFFGFLGGDANQWRTPIFENTLPYEAPEQQGPNPKHFNEIMADRAIGWIRMQHSIAPQKPFFAYYAPGGTHAPHHVPKEWIDRFKGQFDQGWDKVREETLARQKQLGVVPANTQLTPRPKEIPSWDSLTDEQRKVYARMMEVYAAYLAQTDHEIGRVINAVSDLGELNNTVIIYIQGDNGASAEGTLQGTSNEIGTNANGVPEDIQYLASIMDGLGGPLYYNHYPVGWAHAMDAPLQWTKQVASHFGGTANGLVISYPKRIHDKGGQRTQFCHVTDITPTILELAGITFPTMINGVKQKPLEGVSLVYTFDDANAPTRHPTQYFEMMANRAIYDHGWMASTTPMRLPWINFGASPNPEDFKWELYHVDEDFSQANNLAASEPAKLKELQQVFDREAWKYNVYPLDSTMAERVDPAIRPSLTKGRNDFTYYQGQIRIPEGTSPDVKNKSYTMTADVEVPDGGAEGVLGTLGGRFGGWALLLTDGKPEFVYAFSNQPQDKYRIASSQPLSPGKHTIEFDFKYDGGGIGKGGTGTLRVDGKQVAQGRLEHTIQARFSFDETMDFGEDTGTPVTEDYAAKMPFKFTGTLNRFVIHLGDGRLSSSDEQELREAGRKAAAIRQ